MTTRTRYRLRALALEDLEEIWDYTFDQWGIEQAERYLDALFVCFDDLAKNPGLGKEREEVKRGYRSFPQGRHVIFYTTGQAEIEIIGIVHQSADINRHLDND